MDRIYDTLVDEDKFRETDAVIGGIAEKLEPRGYSSREFMEILGDHVKDKNSILYNCRKYGVPMFVPALNDSSIGIGLTGLYQRARAAKKPFMHMDSIRDNWELTQMKIKAEKTGVIYIGGGVPKNFIQQTEVIAETLGYDKGGHHYAIQITMDAPQWGGLSGCTFEEAQSWGKIQPGREQVRGVRRGIDRAVAARRLYPAVRGMEGPEEAEEHLEEDMLTSVKRVPLNIEK